MAGQLKDNFDYIFEQNDFPRTVPSSKLTLLKLSH